jgi:Fe-S-cluster containining protein
LAELGAIYQRADRLAASAPHDGCQRCARCCQFALLGREPYVTSLELAALVRAVRSRGGPPAALEADERKICPLLTTEFRCAVYAARPLGCRTFWCKAAESDARATERREVLALVREVKELAARHEPGGDQGRPLWAALRALLRR